MTRWWLRLSARDRRALTLGAWIVLPALGVAFVLRPAAAQLQQLRDTLAAERLLLDREHQAIADARGVAGNGVAGSGVAGNGTAERPVAERLFSGRDDVIATSALAAYVGTLAEAQDVWVQSATTLDATRDPAGVRQLRIAVRAEADVAGVVRLLDALDRGRYFVRVDELEIAVTPADRSPDGSEPLTVRATVSGFAAPVAEDTP